jgi:hypothetical protein
VSDAIVTAVADGRQVTVVLLIETAPKFSSVVVGPRCTTGENCT